MDTSILNSEFKYKINNASHLSVKKRQHDNE